jgi:hypothetical protein
MKKQSKSNYFYQKYDKLQNNEFFLFSFFPISKSEVDLHINRNNELNKLKRYMLPSSFKLVKTLSVQGPRIGMIYSCNLNFTKLNLVYNLKANNCIIKKKWYAYDLLLELKQYKTPQSLCSGAHQALKKKILDFSLFLKIPCIV